MTSLAGHSTIRVDPQTVPHPTSQASLYAWCVAALAVAMPLASGLRGFSPEAGRLILILMDLVLVGLFLRVVTRTRSAYLSATIAVMIAIGLLIQFTSNLGPDIATLYQGFRKSLLWLMAIVVGLNVSVSYRPFVFKAIILTLVLVCLYGVKQFFFFSEFDRALLAAQSAGEYANVIGGRQRAISVLSSGFHLGMAGCLLCAFALFSKNLSRWLAALFVGVAGLAVYVSLTRTFLLIFVMLVVWRLFLSSWYRAVAALTVTALILSLLNFMGFDVVATAFDSALSDDRFTNRQLSYQLFSAYMDADGFRWLLGFGPGSAGSTLGNSFNAVSAPWIEPHNIFLKYTFEYGVILAGIVFACVAWATYQTRSIPGLYDRGLASAALAILVISGLTITSVEATPISIYVGLIIGIMARRSTLPHQTHGVR